MSDAKLINGDCIDEMQKLIDDGVKVDMVLTDPPYLMNYYSKWITDKSHDFCKPLMYKESIQRFHFPFQFTYPFFKVNFTE